MTEQEMGRLAYSILLYKRRMRGMRIGMNLIRSIHQEADSIGVPHEEGLAFAKVFVRDLLNGLEPFGFHVQIENELPVARRNEIAFLSLRAEVLGNPLKLAVDIRREITKGAKEMGEDPDAIMQLFEKIVRDRVNEMFIENTGDTIED